MKIGFDAKRITKNKTGLGNYSRFVVNGLSTYFPENDYNLYSPNIGNPDLKAQVRNSPHINYHYPSGIYKKSTSLWRSTGIIKDLKKDRIDLFHGLSNELPLTIDKSNIPSVVTIHDLIFLKYPNLYKYMDRKIYSYKFRQACIQSNRIIAVSQKTKEDIHTLFQIPENKIEVIYQGCNPVFGLPVPEEKKKKLRLKYHITTPYILYVGSIEERKNLLLLVKAFKDIKEDIRLIAIGKETGYTNKIKSYIKEYNLEERVQILNNIPFEELPSFFQMADLFVYPSFYEGFGIPILEALTANIPVIAATGSCLEEAGGPHSLYTDPENPEELRDMIKTVLLNTSLANQMREEGKEYIKRFSEKKLASDMFNLYQQILG
ncbi:MAG: glycosyltransferase family 4 protein [Tannerellaceae bacterium]|nr:glycosyltransferase family 4 protein [Tannerellaceae bacterium]